MRNGAIALRDHLPPIEMAEPEIQIFNSLASVYDAWFEQKGRLIFASGVEEVNNIELLR